MFVSRFQSSGGHRRQKVCPLAHAELFGDALEARKVRARADNHELHAGQSRREPGERSDQVVHALIGLRRIPSPHRQN